MLASEWLTSEDIDWGPEIATRHIDQTARAKGMSPCRQRYIIENVSFNCLLTLWCSALRPRISVEAGCGRDDGAFLWTLPAPLRPRMSPKWACLARLFHYPITKESPPGTDKSGRRPPFPVFWRTVRKVELLHREWLHCLVGFTLVSENKNLTGSPQGEYHATHLTAEWEIFLSGRNLPLSHPLSSHRVCFSNLLPPDVCLLCIFSALPSASRTASLRLRLHRRRLRAVANLAGPTQTL